MSRAARSAFGERVEVQKAQLLAGTVGGSFERETR